MIATTSGRAVHANYLSPSLFSAYLRPRPISALCAQQSQWYNWEEQMGTRDGRERERERENMKYIQSIAKAWDCSARGGNAKGEVNVCPLLMKISRGSSPRMPYPAHQAWAWSVLFTFCSVLNRYCFIDIDADERFLLLTKRKKRRNVIQSTEKFKFNQNIIAASFTDLHRGIEWER